MKTNKSKFGIHDIVDVEFPSQATLTGCTIVAVHFIQLPKAEYDLMVPISKDEYAGIFGISEIFLKPIE